MSSRPCRVYWPFLCEKGGLSLVWPTVHSYPVKRVTENASFQEHNASFQEQQSGDL